MEDVRDELAGGEDDCIDERAGKLDEIGTKSITGAPGRVMTTFERELDVRRTVGWTLTHAAAGTQLRVN